ncbi:hypothetical protein MtrunA17_Chr8g0366511 [Medicago truncatula]|uniref:Uncharacterized protein n=1 Tax=Medicago truncatula TaxID=3880 RepID=A0A396GK22_MEDTR|nr:hypothetical protein MtrunA17_Chr8g0366511 [Medicago truncatula]
MGTGNHGVFSCMVIHKPSSSAIFHVSKIGNISYYSSIRSHRSNRHISY